MAKFYIQTDKGLIQVGNDITLENIKAALGYIPSNFSGDFYDLNNNPFSNGSSGEFNIVDENQNIIAIVDKDGIHSVEMTAIKSGITHNLTEKMDVSEFESIITVDESGKFVIEDENGNEGLKLDSTGLYVKDVTAGKHVLSQKADLNDIDFNNLVDNPIYIDDTGEFVIEDESGNKGFILNRTGVEAKNFITSDGVSLNDVDNIVNSIKDKVDDVDNRVNSIQDKVDSINEMISDDEDDRFIIRDGDGEVGLELNKDGLYVKDVTTYDNEGNPKDVLSQKADLDIVNKKLDKSEFTETIGVVEGRVDTNESNITNLSNTVNSHKSQINSIQGEVDSINEMISDAEESSFIVSDNNDYIGLKLDQEGLHVKDVITRNENGEIEHVLSEKANQSDLEDVDGRLSDIETLLVEDSNDIIDNIRDVIDYFKNVSESEVGEAFINSVSENTNNIKTNADDIKQLSKDVNALDESVNDRIDDLNGYIEGLDKEVDSLNGVVNTHTSDIKTINDNISLIEDDVDSINNMISDAEESSFIVSDHNDYIGLKLDQEGLHVKDVIAYIDKDRDNVLHKLSEKANQSDVDVISVITSASVSVDSNVGTPSATVSLIGDDVKNKTLNFEFKNLKGVKGEMGYGIFYTNTEYNSDTTSIIKSDIIDNVRTIQVGDLVLSSNGNIFSVKKIGDNLNVEYLTSIKGPKGVGILNIEKGEPNGLIDTYTITYTDDDKEPDTFTVTNGKDGASVASISVVGNLEHGSGKTNTYELTDSYGNKLTGNIEVQDGFDGIGIKDITKKDSSDSDSDLVDTYTITYTDDDKEPYDFYVTNGKDGDKGDDGYSIFYTSHPYIEQTAGIIYTYIDTYERTIQVGDLVLSSNGNIFSVKKVGELLDMVTVEYLTSIKGVQGASVSSIVCVDGNNSENLADINNEDGAINYYRIKDNNNNFLEGTIAIKNGSSGSGDDSSDSDGELVDIDIPFEEDESGEFVIIDDSADENIGLILDSEGVAAKDFFTSSDVSLNDVGDRLSVVEDSIGIELITYDNLVQLRNDKLLIPGKKYRITDYVTTTSQASTTSAGHQFDIIVTALTENELSEIVSACYHEENYNEDNLEELYIGEFNSILGWDGGGHTFSYSGIRYIDGKVYLEYLDKNNSGNKLYFDFNDKSKVYFDSSDVIKFIPSYYIAPEYGYNDLTENNVSLLGDGDFYVPYISTYDNMVDGNETQISISIREEFNRNYFKNLGCNLSAWKIWYSLDNNSDRFAWAKSNGKGVIYRMIDEWGNDCPYDFKNIQFSKTIDDETITSYTFSWRKEYTLDFSTPTTPMFSKGIYIKDTSIAGNNGLLLDDEGNIPGVYNNVIKPNMYTYGNNQYLNKQYLNKICFCSSFDYDGYYHICINNSFGNNCSSNTFGNNCSYNTFGNDCHSNTFGNDCNYNTFCNDCYSNTFGNDCYSNTFCNKVFRNTFGNTCSSNIFGNVCFDNTFGDDCFYNTFGNDCFYNTFGNACYDNTFGNACSSNTFGNYCFQNTFGNICDNIIFGNSKSTPSSYYRYIIIDSGNRYINLHCTSTTSSSNYYQNVRIELGVNNTTTYKTISDSNVNQTYETLYKPANSQTITI